MAFTYVLALIGPRATHIHGYGLISSDPIESPLLAFGAHADHARENLAFLPSALFSDDDARPACGGASLRISRL